MHISVHLSKKGMYMSQKKDQIILNYLEKPERLADLINVNCFRGEQVVKESDIHVLSGETKHIIKDKNGEILTVSRFRDILRAVTANGIFIIIGCENQMKIHYAMPVREMLYDALNYTDQVKQIAREHKKNKEWKNSEEFLSGMTKEDRLKPVITLLLYYGEKPWDGSLDLHGILEFGEYEYLKEYVPNYRMNLISVRCPEDLQHYHTDLREFLGIMKYASDAWGMERYVERNKARFDCVEEDLLEVIAELLGEKKRLMLVKEEVEEEGGKINMCKAFDQLEERGFRKGRELGIEQGIKQGIEVFILDKMEDKVEPQKIIEKLQYRFSLTYGDAWKYLERYM
ncbi:MAG: hypothetical protein EOM18_01780 [Clostridia bacterium]|nr:hypothetical protein [Clostridia bacterium]